MTFRSEPALKVHKSDAHGAARQGVDRQVSSRIRGELSQAGLLRSQPEYTTRGPRRGRTRGNQARDSSDYPQHPMPTMQPGPVVFVGPEDFQQSDVICGQILRLGLQQDILIGEEGHIECGGMNWTRVGVSRQGDVAGMLEKLCHLPKILQSSEYVPAPKTFKDEYKLPYPVVDFTHSPDRNPLRPALAVVAISCSKVLLADGLQEVVKVAAVDVLTCRILMNALVCTNPYATVDDWRSTSTGMASYHDMEAARRDGYKVFKGWKAAKAALYKFIDMQTIIVGQNLRGDLDALRMVHGRSVDIAKTVEKAAGGALSKRQLSLETLCRDLPAAHLTTHPTFGRDALQNAFAIRELALWALKNEDKLTRWAKARSNEFMMVNLNRA
ncbi:hypothetical protein BDV96DRAFT_572547 [Lophiotrema nucula]|uniref:Exonuclease domain-containing protein n=1 Tax=Lophiotrema nucula TaxID=690887 RepID=A0A6A5ZBL6_9PLEO|nr:hypothetical protein BDV96DRAFT_572547 [Lophiotrema nucula]